MFELPYPNTRYAEALDRIQQIDYEVELADKHTLEEQEERAFFERCKRSKVSRARLKILFKEYRRTQKCKK